MNKLNWVGNKSTMIVHNVCCDYADAVSTDNAVWFVQLHHALSAGFVECGYCLTEAPYIERVKQRQEART